MTEQEISRLIVQALEPCVASFPDPSQELDQKALRLITRTYSLLIAAQKLQRKRQEK
jgi:hypothetical protein